jgi:hypothetical protein
VSRREGAEQNTAKKIFSSELDESQKEELALAEAQLG